MHVFIIILRRVSLAEIISGLVKIRELDKPELTFCTVHNIIRTDGVRKRLAKGHMPDMFCTTGM